MSSPSPSAVVASDPAIIAAATLEARRGAAALQSLSQDGTQWTLIDESNKVKIYEQAANVSDDGHSVFKGVGVIQAPPNVVMELLMDSQRKTSYDSVFEKAEFIEDYSDNLKVEHQVYWAPFPVTSRDFCMLLHKARLEDGTIILFAKSTKHARVPELSKYVRGELIVGGWLLRAVPGEEGAAASSTHVTFVACSDLAGSIPALIKKQLGRKQPALINTIRPILAKRVAEIGKIKDAAEKQRVLDQLRALVDILPTYTNQDLEEARAPKPLEP